MNDYTISIFDNKIFFEIIKEIKLFSEFKIKHYEDLNQCVEEEQKMNQIFIFFFNSKDKIKENNIPLISIVKSKSSTKKPLGQISEELKMPFTILDFKKKVISVISKNEFRKNSLVHLSGYIIDKNERKIKKNNLELKLSEKEVNFLVLFSQSQKPISKNKVLKNVWKYSSDSETHTVETHIHRLRKKILQKFGDSNFIKNDGKGYYI